jgi:hypothetical protein
MSLKPYHVSRASPTKEGNNQHDKLLFVLSISKNNTPQSYFNFKSLANNVNGNLLAKYIYKCTNIIDYLAFKKI